MSENTESISPGLQWLLERWMEKFASVINSMIEEQPSLSWQKGADDELGDGALIVEQRFASLPDPLLWLGVPEAVHQDLGRRVLKIAGVENSEAEENKATCLEIIEQSLAGLTGSLMQRTSREMKREPALECLLFPQGFHVVQVVITISEKELPPLAIAFAPLLASWMEEKAIEPAVAEPPVQKSALEPEQPPVSRTFELLLDVALPVSISFGKTELPVKDVLKLTTGSIVELNRSVNEPVDIIVNGCTIARGEVVVVEGNYGVRITNIVSRKERLRTGGAAVAESRALVGRK